MLFHYDPPRLDSVAVLPGHSASPAGGFMVALHGASFGPSPAVYIGRVPCGVNATVAQQNYITCTAGPRLSLETYVEVEVQGRVAGGFPRGPQLAFDPPTLVEVSPNIVDAFVGGAIDVKGRNFGHVGAAANNVTIQVGRYACADVALLADTHARCTIASGLDTGEVVATITSWEVQSNAVAVELRCSKGYYAASDGQPCEPCPIGAECGGMLALPVALPGFFSLVRAYLPMLCSVGLCLLTPAVVVALCGCSLLCRIRLSWRAHLRKRVRAAPAVRALPDTPASCAVPVRSSGTASNSAANLALILHGSCSLPSLSASWPSWRVACTCKARP